MALAGDMSVESPFGYIADLDRGEGIRQELSRICLDAECMTRQEPLVARFEPWAGPDGRISYGKAATRILEIVGCSHLPQPEGIATSL